MATTGEGDDGVSSNKDAGGNFVAYMGVSPFSDLKNKWLSGLSWEMGAWFCKVDNFRATGSGSNLHGIDPVQNCSRLRIRDSGDGGRTTLFDTGSRRIGRGLMHQLYPGVQWQVGPYTFRMAADFARWRNGQDTGAATRPGLTKGNSWVIAHELFIFSLKGLLTGSPSTPGSVLVGTRFERTDVDCNYGGGAPGLSAAVGGSGGCTGAGFNRNVILVRQWGVYYFLMNRISTGINWTWYDASNIPNFSRHNLGLSNRRDGSARGGSWVEYT